MARLMQRACRRPGAGRNRRRTRQAGALGAIVTGVDLATDVDDATFDALHDGAARAPRDLRPGPGAHHARRPGRVLGAVGPHRAAPVRAADRGPSRDHARSTTRTPSPSPGTPTSPTPSSHRRSACCWAGSSPPSAATRCSPTATSPTRTCPPACARRSTACARCTTRPSWRSTAACPRTRSSTRTPWSCTHPETGRRALFVNGNYTRHFDGWSRRRQPAAARPPLRASSPASSTRGVTGGSRATSSSGTTAACSTRSSATPTARSASLHRTTIAGDTHRRMTDIPWIVSLDDHVVEPPDIWTEPPAREVPRRRPAHRDGARRHAGARRRHLPRGARHRGRPGRVVVLRGPAVLGEAPHRRRRLPGRRDQLRRHHLRPDAPGVLAAAGPPRRHDA